jgi:hypothetical protein
MQNLHSFKLILKYVKIIFIHLIVEFELLFNVAGQCKNISANLYSATPFTFLVIAFYMQKGKISNRVNSILKPHCTLSCSITNFFLKCPLTAEKTFIDI